MVLGPALQEPASAYPEARMLPRAAPRPRPGACTLESSLRCLLTLDNLVLRGGVANSRKSTSPRRCWTGASRAGICLSRGAHAAPGFPEASSRRLHPGPALQEVTEAQRPVALTERFGLQDCCTKHDPLRGTIREVDRGLSLAGTQTGRYVRFYSRRRFAKVIHTLSLPKQYTL